ncbi:DUF4224 domain-containing protein [Paraburkholderia sp. 31.1]|uniref:DUF4224 domain-containing protein n=1 Tax=Paraburkholderia sp. 31.1 TaxID=2615205 RepID=UPI0016554553|nr:DUF4224 domain-containing protein [Paraburkholderia sp. 31.1]MBC8725820.1 DUF4224 domain-containing protein [Paraburkholderia sp. 31.1]
MIGSMFLSADELIELTGRRQRASQESALRAMGIEHKVRADGRLVVSRRHVEQQLGAASDSSTQNEIMPDWSAA